MGVRTALDSLRLAEPISDATRQSATILPISVANISFTALYREGGEEPAHSYQFIPRDKFLVLTLKSLIGLLCSWI